MFQKYCILCILFLGYVFQNDELNVKASDQSSEFILLDENINSQNRPFIKNSKFSVTINRKAEISNNEVKQIQKSCLCKWNTPYDVEQFISNCKANPSSKIIMSTIIDNTAKCLEFSLLTRVLTYAHDRLGPFDLGRAEVDLTLEELAQTPYLYRWDNTDDIKQFIDYFTIKQRHSEPLHVTILIALNGTTRQMGNNFAKLESLFKYAAAQTKLLRLRQLANLELQLLNSPYLYRWSSTEDVDSLIAYYRKYNTSGNLSWKSGRPQMIIRNTEEQLGYDFAELQRIFEYAKTQFQAPFLLYFQQLIAKELDIIKQHPYLFKWESIDDLFKARAAIHNIMELHYVRLKSVLKDIGSNAENLAILFCATQLPFDAHDIEIINDKINQMMENANVILTEQTKQLDKFAESQSTPKEASPMEQAMKDLQAAFAALRVPQTESASESELLESLKGQDKQKAQLATIIFNHQIISLFNQMDKPCKLYIPELISGSVKLSRTVGGGVFKSAWVQAFNKRVSTDLRKVDISLDTVLTQ